MINSNYFKHSSSVISEKATIGDGTSIWHFSHIREGAKIGKNVTIGQNVYIDKDVVIGDNVKIGNNTKIWAFSHISQGVVIGDNCIIGEGVHIGPNVIIGNNCKIQNNVSIYKGVTIGQNVFVGPGVTFTNDLYPEVGNWSEEKIIPTFVKDNVSIGANSTIVCGITLNESCLIGAGSVVTKDVKSKTIALGNPAIEVKKNKF